MVKSLEEVLAYENKWVLDRFKKACYWFEGTDEDVQQIWEDTKRFLWLYAKVEEERRNNPEVDLPDISISDSMVIIDEMWHAFVLYTQFYIDFCDEFLGGYMHHPVPCEKFVANVKALGEPQAKEIFVSEMVEYVFEVFGEEISIRWFDEYFKFSPPDMSSSEHHYTV